MGEDQWQNVRDIFEQALDQPEGERGTFVAEACGGDADLERDVLSLLEHDQQAAADFMRPLDHGPDDEAHAIDSDPLIGQRVGQFEVTGVIATGGMGAVYEAEQENPRRVIALKILRGGVTSRYALRHFEHESQILASLRHPNIAQVLAAGTHRSEAASGLPVPYFAMEYIPGARTITAFARAGNLGTRDRLKLILQACDAVQHGHQKGIIHRDLKPGNILVGADGQVKIIDFGVARSTDSDVAVTTLHTDVGRLVGTLQYMSPEQCTGDPRELDVRTDVYSLGVVLYELLTDHLPYEVSSTDLYDATRTIRETSPVRPSHLVPKLRGDVETIVLKAIDKERDRRYPSVDALAADVRRYLRREPIVARPPTVAYLMRKFVARHTWKVAAVGGGGLALLAAMVALALGNAWQVADQARAAAQQARQVADVRAYGARMIAAEGAVQVFDGGNAARILDETEAEHRGWEWYHLRHRADQSLRTVLEHPGEHVILNTSPSLDSVVITWGETGGVTVSDVADGTQRQDLSVAGLSVRHTAFNADGSMLVLAGLDAHRVREDGMLQLWRRAPDGRFRPAASWIGHDSPICAIAFHPQLDLLIGATCDGHLKVYNLHDPTEAAPPEPAGNFRHPVVTGHGEEVTSIVFSPDGSLLATPSRDFSTSGCGTPGS